MMCHFLSALVLRSGQVLTHPMLDSHSDLVTYFKLPDTSTNIRRFVKVELTPDPSAWLDPDRWAWTVDEETLPQWWGDVAAEAEATLRAKAKLTVLTTGEHHLIVDGCWIVGGTAIVRDVRAGRLHVGGEAQIHAVGRSAQIHVVRDAAQIYGAWGATQIHGVGGSAVIYEVRDAAQIYGVRDAAQIHEVRDATQIHDDRRRGVVGRRGAD